VQFTIGEKGEAVEGADRKDGSKDKDMAGRKGKIAPPPQWFLQLCAHEQPAVGCRSVIVQGMNDDGGRRLDRSNYTA